LQSRCPSDRLAEPQYSYAGTAQSENALLKEGIWEKVTDVIRDVNYGKFSASGLFLSNVKSISI
jgi:hypothetical protein